MPDSARDVIQARGGAVARENLLGYLKNALAVALRVGAGFAGRRRWRELLFRHAEFGKKFLQPETSPVILHIRGLTPFYQAGARMSTSGATFVAAPPTTGERRCVYL